MRAPEEYGDRAWELPTGLTMALAGNARAFKAFSMLSPEEQSAIIARAGAVHSKGEMTSIIKELESGSAT